MVFSGGNKLTTGIESTTAADEYRKYVRSLSFPELLDYYDSWPDALSVPTRLRNILLANHKMFPFATVGEYLDAGDAATSLFKSIPSFGNKTGRDLSNLVDEVMNADTANIAFVRHDKISRQEKVHAIRALSFLELTERDLRYLVDEAMNADTANISIVRNDNATPITSNEQQEKLNGIRFLSFPELLDFYDSWPGALFVPTRLRNILMATHKTFPFASVGKYLDAGDAATSLLMSIPNFGKKTERDLRRIIGEAMNADVSCIAVRQHDNVPPIISSEQQEKLDAVRAITFPDLIERSYVSPRLRNSISHEIKKGTFPFSNLGEYFDKGGISVLMSIPDFGKKTALELEGLIGVVAGSVAFASQAVVAYPKKLELAEQLEEKYPGVFDPLLDAYRQVSDVYALTCQRLEKQIQQLLKKPQHAEICQRRFFGEILEDIGKDFGLTRERVRQIEKKYKGLFTDIYTESWLTRSLQTALGKAEKSNQLPANEELDKCHPKMQYALRKVFLPERHGSGYLDSQERHDLAEKFGLDGAIELINAKHPASGNTNPTVSINAKSCR